MDILDNKKRYYRKGNYDKECADWRKKYGDKIITKEIKIPNWMKTKNTRRKRK